MNVDLVDRLEAEAAQGWPVPWWPQDRPDGALGVYIDLVAEAVLPSEREWWRNWSQIAMEGTDG